MPRPKIRGLVWSPDDEAAFRKWRRAVLDPLFEGRARHGVDADMLVVDHGAHPVAVKRHRGTREIRRSAARSHHHLHPIRVCRPGGWQRAGGRPDRGPASDLA